MLEGSFFVDLERFLYTKTLRNPPTFATCSKHTCLTLNVFRRPTLKEIRTCISVIASHELLKYENPKNVIPFGFSLTDFFAKVPAENYHRF